MQRTDFKYLVQNKVLIIDGGLNSEIQRRAKAQFPFSPRFILKEEALVAEIHRDFGKAGANLLVSATAAANRTVLQKNLFKDRVEDVNRKAVELCRSVAPPDALVFGGLGPTEVLLKPYGPFSEADYQDVYRQQANILIDTGVDGFILEGFSSLIEAEQCLIALRDICVLPVIAMMTFLEDGGTKFGDSIEDCFKALLRKGADMVGIQGTLGPLEIEGFLEHLSEPYPLCVRPNAGYPVRLGNTTTYLSSPEYVAECAELFVEHGASIVGGAAGFTPAHIKAVAERLHGKKPQIPTGKEPMSRVVVTGTENSSQVKTSGPTFAEKLRNRSVLSVEVEPPQGLEIQSTLELFEKLKPFGIDAINIPENPLARARISSIALAKLVRERTGFESITHLTCRDRNLISLQAELLGAHVLGVKNILALTGDPTSVGDYPTATSNFDVDSLGLVEIMARMNIGKDFGMNDLGDKTNFNIGVTANPISQNIKGELLRLEMKLKRGATFIQTQPIFDPTSVKSFLKEITSYRVPVIFGVMLIRDYRHAKFLVNEYPGISISEKVIQSFKQVDSNSQSNIAVSLACDLVKEFRNMDMSVYLMPSFGNSDQLVDVLENLT